MKRIVGLVLWLLGFVATTMLLVYSMGVLMFASSLGGDSWLAVGLLLLSTGLFAILAATFRRAFPERWP